MKTANAFALFFTLAFFALASAPLAADGADETKYSTSLNFVAATTLETKVKLIETITVPCLQGDGALVEGNNAQFKFGAELSPVSVNGTFEARLTPVAFIQLVAGGSVGTGWNIPIASGLRMNERSGAHDSDLSDAAFSGAVWSVKGGGLFQFDLAAVVPGDWNHVVFQTYHAGQYRSLSSADSGESWLYEADAGENRNGWNYYGNYFLGYKMPIALNTAGVLFEEDLYLFDTEGRALWGDDLSRWTFGPMLNFTVTKNLSAALLVQWRTLRTFTDETEDYGFYQDRLVVDSGSPRHVEFYRAALNATWLLK